MRCPTCSHENPDSNKFCAECGAELVSVCPSCSTANSGLAARSWLRAHGLRRWEIVLDEYLPADDPVASETA